MSSGAADSPLDLDWVTVALLGNARGNRGELTAIALSKPERFESLREVFLFRGKASRHEVESTWFHDNRLVFKFRGVDTISDAELLTGAKCACHAPTAHRLDPGEYFQSDLVGCEVVERDSGASLGRVIGMAGWRRLGLLEVDGGLLIPFARAICVDIEPAARRIAVELPEGLKELNQAVIFHVLTIFPEFFAGRSRTAWSAARATPARSTSASTIFAIGRPTATRPLTIAPSAAAKAWC